MEVMEQEEVEAAEVVPRAVAFATMDPAAMEAEAEAEAAVVPVAQAVQAEETLFAFLLPIMAVVAT
jgi:hypothetical protein